MAVRDGSNSKSGRTWLNSGYNLKVSLTRVIDGCDRGCEEKFNDDSAICCLSSWKNGVAPK